MTVSSRGLSSYVPGTLTGTLTGTSISERAVNELIATLSPSTREPDIPEELLKGPVFRKDSYSSDWSELSYMFPRVQFPLEDSRDNDLNLIDRFNRKWNVTTAGLLSVHSFQLSTAWSVRLSELRNIRSSWITSTHIPVSRADSIPAGLFREGDISIMEDMEGGDDRIFEDVYGRQWRVARFVVYSFDRL